MLPRLLLIDDDKFVVPTQVRQTFPAESFGLEVATTGSEGLDRVRAAAPILFFSTSGSPISRD